MMDIAALGSMAGVTFATLAPLLAAVASSLKPRRRPDFYDEVTRRGQEQRQAIADAFLADLERRP